MIRVTNVLNEWEGNNMDSTTEIISAGDLTTHTLTIEEKIEHNTADHPVGNSTYYVSTANVTGGITSFKFYAYYLMNSFSVGQSIQIIKTEAGVSTTYTRTITDVDYINFVIKFTTTGATFLPLYGNTTYSSGVNNIQIYTTEMRNNLVLNVGLNNRNYPYINNKLASVTQGDFGGIVSPNRASLIDESVTRLHLPVDLSTMAVTDVETLDLVSFGSGIGKVEATIERLTDVNSYTRKWEIVINLTNCIHLLDGGVTEDVQTVFDQTLVLYTDTEWYTSSNIIPNPNPISENPYVIMHDLTTIKFFNDPYGLPILSQIVPIAPSFNVGVYYNEESDIFEVSFASVGGAYTDIYVGASYVPLVDSYFKNKTEYQTDLSMVLVTGLVAVGTYSSNTNPDGAGYDLEILSLTNPSLGIYTLEFKIIPNAQFNTFLDSGLYNKDFVVWFKLGHTCHLAYRGEALKKPLQLVPFNGLKASATDWCTIAGDKFTDVLQVDDSYDTTSLTPLTYPIFSKEDHLLTRYNLFVPINKRYRKAKTELIFGLFTDILNTYIVLEEFSINSEYPYDSLNGYSNFDASTPNTYNVQNTNYNLGLETSSRTVGVVPVGFQAFTIFSVFQINWRYWLTQTGLYDFLIAQGLTTKDYITYIKEPDNTPINGYNFFVRTSFEDDTNIYYHFTQIWDIKNYDEQFTAGVPTTGDEWQGSAVIKYYLPDGTEVPNPINDTLMTVEVIVTTGQTATTDSWGNLTIEKLEDNTRWMISTNYNNSTNINNPLVPLVGQTRLKKDLTGANEITYSCLLDCTLLGDNTEYKITIKHLNRDLLTEQARIKFDTRTSVRGQAVLPTDFALDSADSCENIFNVFGYEDDHDNYERNDKTLVLAYNFSDTTVISFKILDENGVDIGYSFTINSSSNDSNVKYTYVDWLTVLLAEGEQRYSVYIVATTGAQVDEILWGMYEAKFYDSDLVLGTVKFRSYFQSIINTNRVSINKNYSYDLNLTDNKIFFDDIRVGGFFGKRQPKTVVENIISSGNNILASYKENLNEYTFKSEPVLSSYSSYLLDFNLLNGLFYEVWDYNPFNHDLYSYKRIALKEVLDVDPIDEFSNKIEVQATFNDYVQSNKMSY